MNELSHLAAELGDFCDKRGWSSCVIGGFAVQHWGEPRMTMVVDLSLLTGFGEEEAFVDEFYGTTMVDCQMREISLCKTGFCYSGTLRGLVSISRSRLCPSRNLRWEGL